VLVSNTGVTQVVGGSGVSVTPGSTPTVSIGQNVATNAAVTFAYVGTTNATGYGGGAFGGAGVNCPGFGASVQTLTLNPSGTQDAIDINGKKCCDYNGTWSGNGLQANAQVLASQFGIFNVAWGVSGTFRSADGKTVTVNGGLILSIQ
jgi:hypothetical protein